MYQIQREMGNMMNGRVILIEVQIEALLKKELLLILTNL